MLLRWHPPREGNCNAALELASAGLKPANAYQSLGTLCATVSNGTVCKPVSGTVPQQPVSTKLDVHHCYHADPRKLHDLAECIALEWTETMNQQTTKGTTTKLRTVEIANPGLDNRIQLVIWGHEADNNVFDSDQGLQIPFSFEATQVRIEVYNGDRSLHTTRSGKFLVGDKRPEIDAAKVAAKDFQTSGGNAKDDEIESLNKKLRRFYNKFGTKDDSGQPVHSPSQVRKLAHKFAGKKERLNEGLAKKYKKSLADLSDTDSDDSETGDIALL